MLMDFVTYKTRMRKKTRNMVSRHSSGGLHTSATSAVYFMCPRHFYS